MKDHTPEDHTTTMDDDETTIYATNDEVVTVTQEEMNELVKKQIIECATEFKPMKEEELIDLFTEVSGLGSGLVPLEKFDFREYTAEYYRKRFPNFPLEFYDLMEKASSEKLANYAKKDIFPEEKRGGMIRINEERIISFGGSGEEPNEGTEPNELTAENLSELDHRALHPSDDLRPPELVRSENTV